MIDTHKKQTFTLLALAVAAVAVAQPHYKAIHIAVYGNQTICLTEKGLVIVPNFESGVTLAALSANSFGEFAGQDQAYNAYEGNASGITSLQPLVGNMAQVWAINDNYTIVGYSEQGLYSDYYQAFVIKNGAVTWIPTLGGQSNTAQGVSTNDLVAGHSYKSNGIIDAYLWNGAKAIDLGSFGGTHSAGGRTFASDAWGVNARGDVVGASWTKTGQQRGFLWSSGTMTNIAPNGRQSWANAINDCGLVVGGYLESDGTTNRALVYSQGKLFDLNLITDGVPTLVYFTNAIQLNNLGQILVVSSDKGTYLLVPV